jgi:hypothetical protein
MRRTRVTARLFIDGEDVGVVEVHGWDGSWGFGEFRPAAAFDAFALRFGRWSLLMHTDPGKDRLSEAALDELREAEQEIDTLRARLLLSDSNEWRGIRQLNIDGEMIEWKEE